MSLLLAALVGEGDGTTLREAVLWLPTGVAVAAVWWLGPRVSVAVVIVVASAWIRVRLDYPTGVVLSGAVGSLAEAFVGGALLRRFDVRPAFARLRDVVGLFVVAAAAPLASIAASWLGRVMFGAFREMPFYSGSTGWWRMNALGLLVVVPLFGIWREPLPQRSTVRGAAAATGLAIALATLLAVVLLVLEPGAFGVMLLHLTLLLALLGALWFGTRGTATIAATTAIVLAAATSVGFGPFLSVGPLQRHGALQLFELCLLAVPLVLGALIAEREVALASRVRSEQDLQALQRILPDATYRLRADGTFLAAVVPPGVVAGFGAGEVVGRRVGDVLVADLADRSLAAVAATLRDERVPPFEFRSDREGTQRVGEARFVKVSAEEVLCVVRDITDQRRLEEDLRQAQKMEAVGRLAGGVAHDFNNILTVITGCGEQLLAALPEGSPVREDAVMIAHAADRAARVTKQMLAFSRQQVLTPQVVDLVAVVDDIAELLRRAVGANCTLAIERPVGPLAVRVDRSQIEQVVMNLVLNARDALPRGGSVRIVLGSQDVADAEARARGGSEGGRHACLAVVDDGVGMDAKTRAHAFEPFFTTKGPGRGTGLGLATVWGIARQSGGFVGIDSVPGAGTTVRVFLPSVALPAATTPPPIAPRSEVHVGTILVAEDDTEVRELLVRALQAAGHTVLAAADGEAAAALAAGSGAAIDMLVTDVLMPRCDGRELADRLRRTRPDLPVLFVSGYTNRALVGASALPPGTAFLGKPFTRQVLQERVRELLARTSV